MNAEGFEVFKERVRIRFRLTAASALHVGSADYMEAGRYFPAKIARDLTGLPYVPGTTLRGALRRAVESVMAGLNPSSDRARPRACDPTSQKACDGDDLCDCCRLFGSTSFASRIAVFDAPQEDAPPAARLSKVRFRLPLDRETLTGVDEAGRAFEYAPPGAEFAGEIELANPRPHEMGLVFMAFDMLDRGEARIGGKRSAGAGRVNVFVREVERITPENVLERADAKEAAKTRAEAASQAAPDEPAGSPDEKEGKTELAAPLKDTLEILKKRRGEMSARELQQVMIGEKGWSNAKFKESGFKDLGRVISECQRLGLIRYAEGRVRMIFGAEQPREERKVEKAPAVAEEESAEVREERKTAREALLAYLVEGR